MQNLIVLCHRCFTWGETQSDLCPECGADVCLDVPDLDRTILSNVLGKPLAVLGTVLVERSELPNYGTLIGATGGLLFAPRLHRRVNGAWEGMTSRRIPGWWPFRGEQSSARFLSWLKKPAPVARNEKQHVDTASADNLGSLDELLMESPGAFFVDLRSIHAVTARRRKITIDRSPLRRLIFWDETEDGSLLTSIQTHLARATKERTATPGGIG